MKLAEFSGFVLSLSSTGHMAPGRKFQERVLALIQSRIGFDAAWWGVGTISPERVLTYQSFLHRLPPAYLDDWVAVAAKDQLAFRVFANPGAGQLSDGARSPELVQFCARYGIHSSLSICLPEPTSSLGMFLSLYRGHGTACFVEEERHLFELLMPHVAAAWRESWKDRIFRHHADREICYAHASDQGLLLDADPEFSRRLLLEWPDWSGTTLMEQVLRVAQTRRAYRGRHIEIHAGDADGAGTTTLWCVPRAAALLTPREESIARQYAIGYSYKEIAKQFDLTPATVRSYLRECYVKLGVSNKYELGGAINVHRIDLPQPPTA